jgi:hypothetical protein
MFRPWPQTCSSCTTDVEHRARRRPEIWWEADTLVVPESTARPAERLLLGATPTTWQPWLDSGAGGVYVVTRPPSVMLHRGKIEGRLRQEGYVDYYVELDAQVCVEVDCDCGAPRRRATLRY